MTWLKYKNLPNNKKKKIKVFLIGATLVNIDMPILISYISFSVSKISLVYHQPTTCARDDLTTFILVFIPPILLKF